MSKPILIIWNPSAGSAANAGNIRVELAARHDVLLIETETPADIKTAIEDSNDVQTIVAAGGDGTIHRVLNAVRSAEIGVNFAVLPLGTGNNFCRSLGVPLELASAVELISRGERRPIDLGIVRAAGGESVFVNLIAGGNSVAVNEMVTEEIKAAWGPFCYLRGAIEKLTDLQGYSIQVRFDAGPEQQFDIWNILIANGRTVGPGIPVAPLASLEDGLLDVILIPNSTLLDAAAMTAELFSGDYLAHDGVVFQQVRRLNLRFKPQSDLAVDGEILSGEIYEIEVLPRHLNVIVGPGYQP